MFAGNAETRTHPSEAKGAVPGWFVDGIILLCALLASAFVYSNAISGEFVWDDKSQIMSNELILQGRNLGTALTSDTWAFMGSDREVSSKYWRPTIVLWWTANYRLFGLRAIGWHTANILLHMAVMVAAYGVLRQLSVRRGLAAAILLIFAVHPVHVESVTWISGSSDLLLAFFLLASFWSVLSALSRPSWIKWAIAIALFVPALLAKESGILYPLLVFIAAWATAKSDLGHRRRIMLAAVATVPFLAVAGAYLLARILILESWGFGGNPHISLGRVILTIPSALAFYLRQTFLPFWIGPSYPLRVVTLSNSGLLNLVLPLLAVVSVGLVTGWLVRREPARQIGLALFLLPLLPALNIGAFHGEHLVRDRYIYLPVLGAMMVAIPAAAGGLRRVFHLSAIRSESVLLAAAIILAIPLGVQTFRYNRTWLSNLALAESLIRFDPTSSINYTMYGLALYHDGRIDESIESFDRALEISPWYETYIHRSTALMDVGRLREAELDLRELIAVHDQDHLAYERLIDCYVRQNRLDKAEEVVREARREHPNRKCAFTARLAVILNRLQRSEEALAELESVRGDVDGEYGPPARMVLFQLGMLYAGLDRRREARDALQEYLVKTEGLGDDLTKLTRRQAEKMLARLER